MSLLFEQECFRFALHPMHVEIMDGFDQRVEFQVPAQPARRMEILAHPLAQIARLAHVNDRAERSFIK